MIHAGLKQLYDIGAEGFFRDESFTTRIESSVCTFLPLSETKYISDQSAAAKDI